MKILKKPAIITILLDIKDTLLFLNKLKIKKPIWLGTSMGGIIGMVLASKFKNIFKGLILNDIEAFIDSATLVKIAAYAKKNCHIR